MHLLSRSFAKRGNQFSTKTNQPFPSLPNSPENVLKVNKNSKPRVNTYFNPSQVNLMRKTSGRGKRNRDENGYPLRVQQQKLISRLYWIYLLGLKIFLPSRVCPRFRRTTRTRMEHQHHLLKLLVDVIVCGTLRQTWSSRLKSWSRNLRRAQNTNNLNRSLRKKRRKSGMVNEQAR